jgi:hypothetical protein
VIGAWLVQSFAVLLSHLNPTLFGTLSVLEAAWLAINLTGLAYTWRNRGAAQRQYAYFRYSPDQRDCLIAEVKLLVQNAFLVLQGAFVLVGLIAASTPSPKSEAAQSAAAITVLLLLLIGPAFLAWVSWRVDRANEKFRRIVEEEAMKEAHLQAAFTREQKAAQQATDNGEAVKEKEGGAV